MDSKKFKAAVDNLVKEKGINEDLIYDAMELALTSATLSTYVLAYLDKTTDWEPA